MNPLQLTYPSRECVRCHRHTHPASEAGLRLCLQCRADDEVLTKASAQSLRWACASFSAYLGYHESRDKIECPLLYEQD